MTASTRERRGHGATAPRVGVLAVQGDFAKHHAVLAALGCQPVRVSLPEHLHDLAALILPGGESSTMLRLLDHTGLRAPLQQWVLCRPVMGTCAGSILLAKHADKLPRPTFGAIDIELERNGWGRQVHSFTDAVSMPAIGDSFQGVFIRAPRITRVGGCAQVIATYQGEPVGVRHGNAIALTFHPELTPDTRVHAWFLETIAGLALRQPQEAR